MPIRIPPSNPFLPTSSLDDPYVFVCPYCGDEFVSSNLTYRDVIEAVENNGGHIETDCGDDGCGALLEIVDPDKLQCWVASDWDCYNLGIDPDDVYGINHSCRVDIIDGCVTVLNSYIEVREYY